jgi:RNA polymerase sigma-70 factor (ECF subfamily)
MHPAQGPDEHALFRTLFDANFAPLLAYARRRTESLPDAEDVVADTFVVAWRRLDALPEDPANRLPWLYGIARRTVLNRRRSTSRRARLAQRLEAAASTLDPPSRLPDVIDAMRRLSQGDREILRLAAWEGLPHAHIGLTLGISANAAAIRLHRARARLKVEMARAAREVKGQGPIRTWLGWKGSTPRAAKREDSR